jgi:hypothetical protein
MPCEKEKMLAELRTIREGSLAFLAETEGRDLREYRRPHPYSANVKYI